MRKVWARLPGVYFAMAVLSGITFYFRFPLPLIVGISGKSRVSIFGFYLIAFLSYINMHVADNVATPDEPCTGVGYYSIHKIRRSISIKRGFFNYQGKLEYFKSDDDEYYNLPCYITATDTKERPLGDCDYIVTGKLKHVEHGLYRMDVTKWEPVDSTFSLAEMRLKLKDQMRKYLKKHVKDRLTYGFFASLGTGEIENQILGTIFSRAGLSHTLAISGFHYTWLLVAFWAIASTFFPGRGTPISLIIIITAYFYFIGESPSLKRAWLVSTIYCFSMLITHKANGLNSLGLATVISLGIDPNALFTISYQLSYLATFAILSIYPPIDAWMRKFLPERRQWEYDEMKWVHKQIAKASSLLRKILVLTIVINGATFLVGLHYFHFYPLAGLLFNLFFPLAITVSLLGIFVGMMPGIGPYILSLNAWYSRHLLEMVYWGSQGVGFLVFEVTQGALVWVVTAILALGLALERKRYGLTRMFDGV